MLQQEVFAFIQSNAQKHLDIPASQGKFYNRICNEIEDLLLPTIIEYFYSSQYTSFSEYLNSNEATLHLSNSSNIRDIYRAFIAECEKSYSFIEPYSKNSSVELLGDCHPVGGMRYLTDKTIYFKKREYYSDLVTGFLELFPELIRCFPKHTETSDMILREYVSIRTDTSSQEEIVQYYVNLGKLIGFILTFRIIDINVENIIANLPYPILFDLECMFSSSHKTDFTYSIASTGIIKSDNENWDISAFTGGLKPLKSYLRPYIAGTDSEPKIEWSAYSNDDKAHLPTLNGKNINPVDHLENLLEGFDSMSKAIVSNISKIKELAQTKIIGTRTIISPTRLYKIILQSYAFPQVYSALTPEQHFRTELEKREPIYDITFGEDLLQDEIDCMKRWLIPKYYSEIHSPNILNEAGKVVATYKTSQYDCWLEHMENLKQLFAESRQLIVETYAKQS